MRLKSWPCAEIGPGDGWLARETLREPQDDAARRAFDRDAHVRMLKYRFGSYELQGSLKDFRPLPCAERRTVICA
jgi:hypothetical protein